MAASGRSVRFSEEQVKQFIRDGGIESMEDVQNALKDLFGQTLQAMLEGEMESHLGYAKGESKNQQASSNNRRNGHGAKSVRSGYGKVDIAVPRDREADFEPLIVKK